MFKAIRTIAKQLEETGFPGSDKVAMYLAENYPDISEFDEDKLFAAKLVLELGEFDNEDEFSPGVIGQLIMRGSDEILKVGFYLNEFGFSTCEISDIFRKSPSFFLSDISNIREIVKRLKSFKLPRELIKSNLSDAVSIGTDETEKRAATALKYFSQKTFEMLAKGFLFYPYRTAPSECIEYAVSKLGLEKAEHLFLENEMLLYWYKDKYERENPFQTQHAHALEIIENIE